VGIVHFSLVVLEVVVLSQIHHRKHHQSVVTLVEQVVVGNLVMPVMAAEEAQATPVEVVRVLDRVLVVVVPAVS
jgi:hypothetical protein